MQKMKKIRLIDSGLCIPLRTHARTDASDTDAQGASDNHPKFSIENCRGATSILLTQWYPPPGKNFVVSYQDSLEDCS